MRSATITSTLSGIAAAVAMLSLGCSKEEPKPSPPPAKSAVAAAPAPTPSAIPAPPPPTATESAPKVDCPKGSSGEGTFDKPCEATGVSRMMEVSWTGKTDDKGPSFRVVNKSQSTILFGKIAVYFYDKAGKQLDAPNTKAGKQPEPSEGDAKSPQSKPFHTCSGNMFGGVMKGGEKAVITFSCVKAAHVPEGTKAIEAEMQMVGFSDETEKKIDYYWRNNDLVPEQRKKGGTKK